MKGESKKVGINWKVFLLCIIVVYAVAFIGGLFTDTGQWYQNLKPSITPPNFVFPIVWNILFFLISLSLYFAWMNSKKKEKVKVGILFGINLFFNVFWSFLFFYVKEVKLAFFDLLAILATAVFLSFCLYNIDRKASFLLLPYILWLCFAGILNYLVAF